MIKARVYLAGRMSDDPADKRWREEITPFLEKLGFDVLDPYELEPLQLKGLRPKRLPKGISHWYDLRNSKDPALYARFKRYMRAIIKYDIRLVQNRADIVIVRWSANCKTGAGTHAEVTTAFMNDKPVYCVAEAEVPAWVEGCLEERFSSFSALRAFFEEQFGSDSPEPLVKHDGK